MMTDTSKIIIMPISTGLMLSIP